MSIHSSYYLPTPPIKFSAISFPWTPQKKPVDPEQATIDTLHTFRSELESTAGYYSTVNADQYKALREMAALKAAGGVESLEKLDQLRKDHTALLKPGFNSIRNDLAEAGLVQFKQPDPPEEGWIDASLPQEYPPVLFKFQHPKLADQVLRIVQRNKLRELLFKLGQSEQNQTDFSPLSSPLRQEWGEDKIIGYMKELEDLGFIIVEGIRNPQPRLTDTGRTFVRGFFKDKYSDQLTQAHPKFQKAPLK